MLADGNHNKCQKRRFVQKANWQIFLLTGKGGTSHPPLADENRIFCFQKRCLFVGASGPLSNLARKSKKIWAQSFSPEATDVKGRNTRLN